MANFYLKFIRYTLHLAKPHPSKVIAPFEHYFSVPDKKILRPRLRKRIVLLFNTVLYVSLSGYAVIDQFRSIRSNIISRLFRQVWDSVAQLSLFTVILLRLSCPALSCPFLSSYLSSFLSSFLASNVLICPSRPCPFAAHCFLCFFSILACQPISGPIYVVLKTMTAECLNYKSKYTTYTI
jgi:hypothetical protein